MTDCRLTTSRIRENPKRKKNAPQRGKRAPKTRARRRIRKSVAGHRRYVVEGVVEKNNRIRFCYWTGSQFAIGLHHAKKYPTQKIPAAERKEIIRGKPASMRAIRIVPA